MDSPTGAGSSGKKDDDVTLPRATINKLIREALPQDVKCTAETQKLMVQCCMEFLQLLSSESNDVCKDNNKKMISPEHVLAALKKLGFADYVPEVTQAYEETKKEASKPRKLKPEDSGLTQEQLLEQQRALFANAKSAWSQKQQPPPNQ